MSDLVGFYEAHVDAEATDFRFLALKEHLARRFQGRAVADVGCGTGTLVRALALEGYTALGIEPDPRLFALAEKVRAGAGAEYTLLNAGIQDLGAERLAPYTDFLLLDVLEHLPDDRAMLAHLAERMPPGGKLLCLLPALESLYGERDRTVGHFRRYSTATARRLFEALPFRTVSVSHWNLLGVPIYWFFEKLAGRPVPEGFRQGTRSLPRRALNAALTAWFRAVENRVRFPVGLSLLVEAVKQPLGRGAI